MSREILIEVEELTKIYRIWESPSARLTGPLLDGITKIFPKSSALHNNISAAAQKAYRDFYALKGISLEVKRGEALGIIGRNGSGKSSLLQVIAGTLQPSSGRVSVTGRVSALLELGSGFNPDFTGRENVYLNGAILGLGRAQMDKRFESIAAFADIGDFIEEPVKTYSSGMLMRLAFSVAVSVEPDILIVDEALSVGDVFFTQKCFARIREILHRGATLIFVSHDMGAVQNLCDRAILLDHGDMVFDGIPEDCVGRYFNLYQPAIQSNATVEGKHQAVLPALRNSVVDKDILIRARSRHGDRKLELVAASVLDGQGHATLEHQMLHRGTIRVLLKAKELIRRPAVGIQIHDRMNNLIFAAGTAQLRFSLPAMVADEEILLDFRVTFSIQPGDYTLSIDAAEFDATDPNVGVFHDRVGGLGPISIGHHAAGALPFYGAAQLPLEIGYA